MTDIANLGIKIDASDADRAAEKLDRLTAAGTRAQAGTGTFTQSIGRLTSSMREVDAASTVATRSHSATQKAMMDVAGAADIMATRQTAALRSLTSEAHVSSRAVNETIVLSRELSRGNFTRMAGSATILAQSLQSTNSSMKDVFRALGLMLNLIREVPPAMAAATASELALNDAAVLVMESEAGAAAAALASAEAQVAAAEKVFAGNEAVARSERDQLKAAVALIAANEELAGAATAAALAEERLAIAEGNAARAAGTAVASTAALGATTAEAGAAGAVEMTALGTALVAVSAVAVIAGIGISAVFVSAKERAGDLTVGMGLTSKQLQKLKDDGVSTSLTLGDVFKGLWKTIKDDLTPSFSVVGAAASKYFKQVAQNGYELAQQLVGGITGAAYAIKAIWGDLPGVFKSIGGAIANAFLASIEWMINKAIAGLNKLIQFANTVGKAVGYDPGLGNVGNVDLGRVKGGGGGGFGNVSGQYAQGDATGRSWVKNQASTAYKNMVGAGQERIDNKDGAPGGGRGRKGRTGAGTDPVSAERSFLETLTQETATMGFNKVEQKLHEINDRANEAAKSGFPALADAIRAAGVAWQAAFSDNAGKEWLKSLTDANQAQAFQTSLLGMNVKQQAIAVENHRFELELIKAQNDGLTISAARMAEINAAHQTALEQAAEKGQRELNVQNARDYADALGQINDNLRLAAQGFGELFGTAGKGFENLINELTGYADAQATLFARIEEDKAKGAQGNADRANAERQYAQNQIQHYGNMLGAAKSFFAQGSAGYKILQAAEQAYRIYQLAASIRAIIMKGAETTAAVTSDATTTASSVAASTTKAAASTVAGAAKMFESLGPLGFIAVGAMLALLASLGFKGHGGGGGATASTGSTGLDTSKITSDAYSSPYSTQPGKNGLYDPANAGAPPAGANYGRGGTIIAPTYNIHAPGADAGTVQQIQDMLDNHTQNTVTLARQASAQDAASLAQRQRIGGA